MDKRVKIVQALSQWLQNEYSKEQLWDMLGSVQALGDYQWDHQCHQSEDKEVFAIVLADELVSWGNCNTLEDYKSYILTKIA